MSINATCLFDFLGFSSLTIEAKAKATLIFVYRSSNHQSTSHNSSRHHDDRDRHRSRSPVRQLSGGHKSPGAHKDHASPSPRHNYLAKVSQPSSRLLAAEPSSKVPRTGGSVDVHSAGSRESRDNRERRDAVSGRQSPSNGSSSRPQLTLSHSHNRDSSSNGRHSVKEQQQAERSRSRSPLHSVSSVERSRQLPNDKPRHHSHQSGISRENSSSSAVDYNTSSSLQLPRLSSSGQLPVPGSAVVSNRLTEPSNRTIGQQQHLPLPSPDAVALQQSQRATAAASMFGLPDIYSSPAAAASLSLMPKADMLFMGRNASVDPVSLLGHMTPSNSGRLPM